VTAIVTVIAAPSVSRPAQRTWIGSPGSGASPPVGIPADQLNSLMLGGVSGPPGGGGYRRMV